VHAANGAGLRPGATGQIGPSRCGAAGGEVKIDWERDAPRLECGLRHSPPAAGGWSRWAAVLPHPGPQASALNIHDTTVTEQTSGIQLPLFIIAVKSWAAFSFPLHSLKKDELTLAFSFPFLPLSGFCCFPWALG